MTASDKPAGSEDKPEIPPEDQSAEEEKEFVPTAWRYSGRFPEGPVAKRFVRYPY